MNDSDMMCSSLDVIEKYGYVAMGLDKALPRLHRIPFSWTGLITYEATGDWTKLQTQILPSTSFTSEPSDFPARAADTRRGILCRLPRLLLSHKSRFRLTDLQVCPPYANEIVPYIPCERKVVL